MSDPKPFEELKRYLEDSGKTQKQVADALGVTQATVSDWINGKLFPSANRFARISDKTGIPLAVLEQRLLEKQYAAPSRTDAQSEVA